MSTPASSESSIVVCSFFPSFLNNLFKWSGITNKEWVVCEAFLPHSTIIPNLRQLSARIINKRRTKCLGLQMVPFVGLFFLCVCVCGYFLSHEASQWNLSSCWCHGAGHMPSHPSWVFSAWLWFSFVQFSPFSVGSVLTLSGQGSHWHYSSASP